MNSKAWINAVIVTMDPSRPRAEGLVTKGAEIVFVGDARDARSRAGEGAEIVDLGGKTLLPGFNDNHVHAVHLGDRAFAPDLGGLDATDIVQLLKERYPDPAKGQIVWAFNWDYPACPNPRKELLDEAFPDNPVVLSQFSGHGQWMNSLALSAVGVKKGKSDPKKGQVLRDGDGEPIGVVRDLGDTPLSKKRQRRLFFQRSVRDSRLELALETFRRFGISSVQDNSWYYPQLWSLERFRREGRLTARFSTWSLGRRPWTTTAMSLVHGLGRFPGPAPHDLDWIRPGPVKYFLDGTFSTRNACLSEPFADDPAAGLCSDPAIPIAELEFLARRGFQGAFHIIGDRGIAIFLDAVEEARKRYPAMEALRIRIEHAQLVRPEDIPRIRKLGLLVAAQPSALGSPEKDDRLLGPARAARAYPYRSLLDEGVRLSFGSDIPGEATCDPLLSIHMAVNRPGRERISVEEAIRCYTVGSAYAEFMEGRKGMLAPGMLADFVVLSEDITAIPTGRIKDCFVLETVVGGASVYKR